METPTLKEARSLCDEGNPHVIGRRAIEMMKRSALQGDVAQISDYIPGVVTVTTPLSESKSSGYQEEVVSAAEHCPVCDAMCLGGCSELGCQMCEGQAGEWFECDCLDGGGSEDPDTCPYHMYDGGVAWNYSYHSDDALDWKYKGLSSPMEAGEDDSLKHDHFTIQDVNNAVKAAQQQGIIDARRQT